MPGQGKRSFADLPRQRTQDVPDARIAYLCAETKQPRPAWLDDPSLLPKKPPSRPKLPEGT